MFLFIAAESNSWETMCRCSTSRLGTAWKPHRMGPAPGISLCVSSVATALYIQHTRVHTSFKLQNIREGCALILTQKVRVLSHCVAPSPSNTIGTRIDHPKTSNTPHRPSTRMVRSIGKCAAFKHGTPDAAERSRDSKSKWTRA